MKKIIVYSPQKMMAEAIKIHLDHHFEMKYLISETNSAQSALNLLDRKPASDFLVCASLSFDSKAEEFLKKAVFSFKETRIIFVGNSFSRNCILKCNQYKIPAVLNNIENLCEAIEVVERGDRFFSRGIELSFSKNKVRNPDKSNQSFMVSLLSGREKEVLSHIASGKTNKEIGQALYISPLTVKTHRKNIHIKLGTKKSSELIRFSIMSEVFTHSSE